MSRVFLMITAFFNIVLEAGGASTNAKYEVMLEKMSDCENPELPYTDKRMVIFEFKIYKVKGKPYLSGKNKVLEEVPFQNYSTSSYSLDVSGRRELVVRVAKSNCRSFMGKTFLVLGNFRYNKSNCRLLKGTSTYKDFDLNKVSHSMPNWHAEGSIVHQINLVANRRTIFCLEALVSVKALN